MKFQHEYNQHFFILFFMVTFLYKNFLRQFTLKTIKIHSNVVKIYSHSSISIEKITNVFNILNKLN